MTKIYRTYQCRIVVTPEEDKLLSSYALLYNRVERTLFAKLQAGKDPVCLKREFLLKFGITARQFNSILLELRGKIASIKERRVQLIKELKQKIARAKKVLLRTTDQTKKHHKQRRLSALQERLRQLKEDDQVRLCFGSKKLFHKQFYLNNYTSHEEWLRDWQAARNNQFSIVGSKGETAGCQSCVAVVDEEGNITLRLRLPNSIGKYLTISGLYFKHGHNTIVSAIGRNLSSDKNDWQPINYRFVRDSKGWRLFVSVSLPKVTIKSHRGLGVIAIDINANHLAICETDRYGNPTAFFSVPCPTYGKSSEQRKAIIGEAIKQVIALAVSRSKPIVIERLDFQAKKSALEKQSRKFARMLSAFAYAQVQVLIRARAYDAGIEVFEVNPAWTSVIGSYKFKDRYGMSEHNSAALVIGRRFQRFGEKLPSQLYSTLSLPARNRGGHVWILWAIVTRKPAAHVVHRQSESILSLPSPVYEDKAWHETYLLGTGEIPVGESSSELFGGRLWNKSQKKETKWVNFDESQKEERSGGILTKVHSFRNGGG
ncbi:MAG: hypothetical protein DDT23_00331 [candidate division WS2 bacterium]|nr:hypothetical protein [Candidatus Lithacetigena glycinireducens]